MPFFVVLQKSKLLTNISPNPSHGKIVIVAMSSAHAIFCANVIDAI